MRSHTFSGQDPIAVLGFLARLKTACDHNGITEGAAVWCFQFYLTGQAHALLQSRLNGNTMAVDVKRRELLRTYPQVINFLLRTYATDEVTSEAVCDVTSSCQSSSMTEEVYSNHLWDMAFHCSTVLSDRRMKSQLVEGLLPATCAQVRNYLATHPDVDYQSVARYAQAIGETNRASRRQGMSAVAHREPSGAARRFDRTARTRPVPSVESASDIPTAGGFAEEAILAVTDQTATPTSMSSPPTSYYPSPAASTAGAPVPTVNSVDARTGPYGRQGQEPRVQFWAGDSPDRRRAGSASTPRTEKRSAPSLPMPACGPSFWRHERPATRRYASGKASARGPRSTARGRPLGETSVRRPPRASTWRRSRTQTLPKSTWHKPRMKPARPCS